MKTITANIFAIIALTVIFSFNVAFAGEWVRVIEMGESSLTVEFPMTPAEIAAVKAKRASLSAIRKAEPAVSSQKLKTIEMGESGYAVTFKMTAEEIAALNAENARLAAIRAAGTKTATENKAGFFAGPALFRKLPATVRYYAACISRFHWNEVIFFDFFSTPDKP
jgi:hypothetical protein